LIELSRDASLSNFCDAGIFARARRNIFVMRKSLYAGVSLILCVSFTGCALYNDVSITPLLLTPGDIRRSASDLPKLVEEGEFLRAIELGRDLDKRAKPSYRDLAALGSAEVSAGRFQEARGHLKQALTLGLPRDLYAQVAWDLSQVEYLEGNYSDSAHWALIATSNGMLVKEWHIDYLRSLAEIETYRIFGPSSVKVAVQMTKPEIPRFEVRVNGKHKVEVAIDTGAVQTIVSRSFADRAGVRSLGDFTGTFYGLLGDPIDVSFGVIDTLELGAMTIMNVPVAIMPDRELQFTVANREPIKMNVLLGTALLKEFRLELDFRNRSVVFTALLPSQKIPRTDQNLFLLNFQPFVQASINKSGWHLFILDTGSEITFLNETRISGTGVRNMPKLHGALLQGLGGVQKRGAKVENIEIGVDRWAGTFKTLPLYATEKSLAVGILGQNLLKHFRVVIDFGAMRVDLHRDRVPSTSELEATIR